MLRISKLPELESFSFVISILISKLISTAWTLLVFSPGADFAKNQMKQFRKVKIHFLKVLYKLYCSIKFKLVYKRLYQSNFVLMKYHQMCRIHFRIEIEVLFPESKRPSSNFFLLRVSSYFSEMKFNLVFQDTFYAFFNYSTVINILMLYICKLAYLLFPWFQNLFGLVLT